MATFLRMMAQRLGIRCVFVPVPFAPVLAGLRTLETLRVRSASLGGRATAVGMRQVEVRDNLGCLRVGRAAESLAGLLGAG
jgi:hypothetical protein